MATATVLTSAEIAEIIHYPVGRVRWVLSTRSIEPVARAGIVRVYGVDAIEKVRTELEQIDRRKGRDA